MQKGKPCSNQFEDLLQTLMKPDCDGSGDVVDDDDDDDDHERRSPASLRLKKMTAFKSCAQEASSYSCRSETGSFIDTFMAHMEERHSC